MWDETREHIKCFFFFGFSILFIFGSLTIYNLRCIRSTEYGYHRVISFHLRIRIFFFFVCTGKPYICGVCGSVQRDGETESETKQSTYTRSLLYIVYNCTLCLMFIFKNIYWNWWMYYRPVTQLNCSFMKTKKKKKKPVKMLSCYIVYACRRRSTNKIFQTTKKKIIRVGTRNHYPLISQRYVPTTSTQKKYTLNTHAH